MIQIIIWKTLFKNQNFIAHIFVSFFSILYSKDCMSFVKDLSETLHKFKGVMSTNTKY